ncbi:formin-like protein 5 isoform X1 [Iris pallida]|uniref:Formin-like protein 5 isoform X1 n=1 Tax=Iris pallida TaxID=29817 RepID=A0AAX6FG23_IRIPA|nr:formin-like protein 5 isoform X1 [Iris pallida]
MARMRVSPRPRALSYWQDAGMGPTRIGGANGGATSACGLARRLAKYHFRLL